MAMLDIGNRFRSRGSGRTWTFDAGEMARLAGGAVIEQPIGPDLIALAMRNDTIA